MDYPATFLTCLPFVLKEECPFPNDWSNPKNFSDDAFDPGGKTMCGITQKEYDRDRINRNLPLRDVREITRDEGYSIYYHSYWLPFCPSQAPGLNLSFFDECVNAGPHEATIILQRSINADVTLPLPTLSVDGFFGPKTSAAVAFLRHPSDVGNVIERYGYYRNQFYRSLSGFPHFGKGWLERVASIEVTSQKMTIAIPREVAPAKPSIAPTRSAPTMPPLASPKDQGALTEIEQALETANSVLPNIIGMLSVFIPQLKGIIPFLSLLPTAINAVHQIQQVTGAASGTAVAQVASTLTPGAPNSEVLTGQMQGSGA